MGGVAVAGAASAPMLRAKVGVIPAVAMVGFTGAAGLADTDLPSCATGICRAAAATGRELVIVVVGTTVTADWLT